MNNFFRLLFASCLGTLLALGVLILIGVISVTSIAAAFGSDDVSVEANSVLVLRPGLLPELTNNLTRSSFSLEEDDILGLRDMARALDEAADDDDIKGVFLDVQGFASMPATALALRQALLRFRESGKFVVTHAKYYGQGGYYLASAADAVYLNPTGAIDARGYGTTVPYFKEGLDDLGIDANVFYAGDFKSAGEPFFRNSMSDSNRLQTREYLEGLWKIWLYDVAASRGIDFNTLETATESYAIRDDEDALQYQLVDALYYKDQVLDNLRERLGLDDDDDINTVSVEDYFKKVKTPNLTSKRRIAVVYAEGNIVDGMGDVGSIGDAKYAKVIRDLRNDDKIKAIVLRVNSGGGSAMASENIWRELQLARDQGIPVVTSMGDLAASGGYYIAAATDSIYAEPNTLTGSIGVVGILFNFSRLMEDKLGVHFDTVNTGKYSNAFSPVLPFSEQDREFLQEGVDDIYELFVRRVAEGRNMPVSRVKELAKGRVWTGEAALERGLVDRIGGLDEAINAVARMADLDLDDVRISEYPEVKDPLEQLIEQLAGKDKEDRSINISDALLTREFGDAYKAYRRAKMLSELKGPQMLMLEELVVR